MIGKIKHQKGRVFVAMSGGVDSSVSAALLKRAGYDVTGVFIRVWEPPFASARGVCTWREDRRDAMRVAAVLDIPFLTIDLSKEYKQEVVDYMITEYRAGRTPNPDVMCNRQIKFGAFFRAAIKRGADFVATGHYARLKKDEQGKIRLLAATDKNKDQTYFLWTLTQKELARTLFPIGDYTKPTVRKLAKKFGLPTAAKTESQGLCFIGKLDVSEFLKEFIKPKAGAVVNEVGEKIGRHNGVWFYTIGQRHGFTVTQKTPTDRPYHVIGKNIKKNTLIVSQNWQTEAAGKEEVLIKDVHWISGYLLKANKSRHKVGIPTPPWRMSGLKTRIRYRQPLQSCQFSPLGSSTPKWRVVFDKPQAMVAAGQSIVFYAGDECLGGGVID